MSAAQAHHAIAFEPFEPARRIIAYAGLPPFHGADVRANRGIGIEYADETNRRYVLAQWPARGGQIGGFPPYAVRIQTCADVRTFTRGTKPNGIVWSTPHGLVMTLQTDGASDARTLDVEWKRLIRRGACR